MARFTCKPPGGGKEVLTRDLHSEEALCRGTPTKPNVDHVAQKVKVQT